MSENTATASCEGRRRIAIVGVGAMGGAILEGLLESTSDVAASLDPSSFICVVRSADKAQGISERLGVGCVSDVAALGSEVFDNVILAVKPQGMQKVLEQLAMLPQFSNPQQSPLVISIAAGIPTQTFEDALGEGSRVVRVMPNMPLQVGCGATVVAGGKHATDADIAFVNGMFEALGYSAIVDESQIDAACAISGGGPAYVAHLVELLSEAGVAAGLSEDLSKQLALRTLIGTALVLDEGREPSELRVSVCSPGGTTLAALDAMKEAGFDDSIDAGIKAAIKRAQELAS